MDIKLIQNETDYDAAMVRVSELMDLNPLLHSPESNELEVWATLIEKYEAEQESIDLPSPIEAIKFRMGQMGFNQNDMVDYFGSKAKVSEVLNEKRTLTLAMMRKLVNGLGIPASVFLQDEKVQLDNKNINWLSFPLKDMLKKHYFPDFTGKLAELKELAEEQVKSFFDTVPHSWNLPKAQMKSTAHGDNDKEVNDYALWAWQVKVLQRCQLNNIANFEQDSINLDLMKRIARYSFLDEGPVIVKEFLAKHGIHMIVEPHLDQTYLDGAAFMTEDGHPVVAVTLRYDRLDSFWFTLLHEVGHIALEHVNSKMPFIFDSNLNPDDTEEKEKQANDLASDAFGLKREELLSVLKYADVVQLSNQYDLSPSIIIGQVRRFRKDYRLFSKKMGKVRHLFEI